MKKNINLNNPNHPWHMPPTGESAMAKFTKVASKIRINEADK